MKSGYESLIWINDKGGREYVCSIDNQSKHVYFEQLTEDEKNSCSNVNEIVGTERW